MHFIFRRLHSQQLRVPFRIFLRFASDEPSISWDLATEPERGLAREVDIVAIAPIELAKGIIQIGAVTHRSSSRIHG